MQRWPGILLCVIVFALSSTAALASSTCTFLDEALTNFDHKLYVVDPEDTNPTISIRKGDHLIYVPYHRPLREELFVFIPGTNTDPTGYENVARIAAFAGYKTIVLAYPNHEAIRDRCYDFGADCTLHLRREILYGGDTSDLVEMPKDDAAIQRLGSLLVYLDENYPQYNWGAYYEDKETILWDRLVVSGHSQGGGHTAVLSLDKELARAVHFSKYGDTCVSCGRVPEPWTLLPRKTPIERQFSFHHREERPHNKWNEMFEAQGLDKFGPIVDAYSSDAPYGCSHTLVTTIEVHNPHSSTAHDNAMPMVGGVPFHQDVYLYLFTAES